MARLLTPGKFTGWSWIAKNSLSVEYGRLIAIKSGFIDNATVWDKIEWMSVETKTFDSDNQTVKKSRLQYARAWDNTEFEIPVTNWIITQANVWDKYDLASDWTVDAWASTPSQLYLRDVITSAKGIFVIAK